MRLLLGAEWPLAGVTWPLRPACDSLAETSRSRLAAKIADARASEAALAAR
jgi:hypothetical protein